MNKSELPTYVFQADGNAILIRNVKPDVESKLYDIGFVETDNGDYQISISNNTQKAKYMSKLRDIGLAFSSGRDWSPADVFEYLRSEGLITGVFTRISWTNPQTFHLREVP